MPALVLIIAKVMALVELALDSFVTITYVPANCDANIYSASYLANVQCDGVGLAHNIETSIAMIAGLIPALLGGLSPIV